MKRCKEEKTATVREKERVEKYIQRGSLFSLLGTSFFRLQFIHEYCFCQSVPPTRRLNKFRRWGGFNMKSDKKRMSRAAIYVILYPNQGPGISEGSTYPYLYSQQTAHQEQKNSTSNAVARLIAVQALDSIQSSLVK